MNVSTAERPTWPRLVTTVAVLWFCGWGLRLTILATPPLIAIIQQDLGLTGTQIGILSGLPVVFFAAVAIPGSLLIARLGVAPTLVLGLVVTAVGSALRGLAPTIHPLYLATMLMAGGVAIMQPAMPAAVRQWLPDRIGFGTAVYTNGLIVGEIVVVSIMLPVVMPLAGESWRAAIAVWSLPVLAIAVVTYALAPRGAATSPTGSGTAGAPAVTVDAAVPRTPWWPDWRNSLVWRIGLIVGSVNSMYFSTNGFLPGYLRSVDRADLIGPGLTAFNVGQLPASFLLLLLAGRLERRVWPYGASGVLALTALGGVVSTASAWTVGWAGVFGFACGAALALGLALPAALSEPRDVPRVSAGTFTLSYLLAMTVSVVSGAVWDWTGIARAAFVPIAISALPMILLTPTLRLGRSAAPRPVISAGGRGARPGTSARP